MRRGINKYSVIGFADSREGKEVELKMRIVNSEWETKKERWRGIRSKVRCWLSCFASSNPRQWKSRFINKLFMSAPQEMNREQCEEYAYWCWVYRLINSSYWICRVKRGGWRQGLKEEWINGMGNELRDEGELC